MKKLRILTVNFDQEIKGQQVSAFRGAVIEKVGRENLLFHHHKSDTKLLYQYPLIQYKSIQRKASLVCLGDGVDEIHKFFNQANWELVLNGKKMDMQIDRLDLNTVTLNVEEKMLSYEITNWIGLNERNYHQYNQETSLVKKIALIERILIGNIIAFAKGVDWQIEKRIELNIKDIISTKVIRHKGTPLMAFNIAFETNVSLPNYIGLGKSASHGFGIIKKV